MPVLNKPKVDAFAKEAKRTTEEKKDVIPMKYNDGLPETPTSQQVEMTSLGWLFVGPPGFGKSEFFSLFPDALMLSFEAGHKFIGCYKMIIDEWEGKGESVDDDGNLHVSFMEALNRIENSERFQFVFLDTIDAMIKKCVDHHVGRANMQHVSELGDYGKGFDLGQNDPVRKSLNRLFATGRGLGLITHQQINTNTFSKGTKSKKETTLPNGIWKIVYPQMDIVIHGEFGGIQEGQKHRDRIIKSEGSEDMLAKNRGGILPSAWISPLNPDARRMQLLSFFDKDPKKQRESVATAYKQFSELYED
jgi:hypothetical protein